MRRLLLWIFVVVAMTFSACGGEGEADGADGVSTTGGAEPGTDTNSPEPSAGDDGGTEGTVAGDRGGAIAYLLTQDLDGHLLG